MHASAKCALVTHAASRTFTTNQPSVAATSPYSDRSMRASSPTRACPVVLAVLARRPDEEAEHEEDACSGHDRDEDVEGEHDPSMPKRRSFRFRTTRSGTRRR